VSTQTDGKWVINPEEKQVNTSTEIEYIAPVVIPRGSRGVSPMRASIKVLAHETDYVERVVETTKHVMPTVVAEPIRIASPARVSYVEERVAIPPPTPQTVHYTTQTVAPPVSVPLAQPLAAPLTTTVGPAISTTVGPAMSVQHGGGFVSSGAALGGGVVSSGAVLGGGVVTRTSAGGVVGGLAGGLAGTLSAEMQSEHQRTRGVGSYSPARADAVHVSSIGG